MSKEGNSHNNMSSHWTDKCVSCPFDKSHRLLPSRLVIHLNKCARNHSGHKLVHCPFNVTHVLAVIDMEKHVATCGNRANLVHFQNPDNLPPAKEEAVSQMPIVESSENWDDEPDVPTYDPSVYCAANPVVRSLHGASPSARRQFREMERKRFRSFQKQSDDASNS